MEERGRQYGSSKPPGLPRRVATRRGREGDGAVLFDPDIVDEQRCGERRHGAGTRVRACVRRQGV